MADRITHSKIWGYYGLFFSSWSSFEAVLELAIIKNLEVEPHKGVIVTADLSFIQKASVLRSLLHPDEKTGL